MNDQLLELVYGFVDGGLTEAETDELREALRREPQLADELYVASLDMALLQDVVAKAVSKGARPAPKREGPVARLVVVEGKNAGASFSIPQGKRRIVLGRREGVEVHILDSKASREHAEVVVQGGRLVLRDLASRNGTYLDGRKLERAEPIAPGSVIRIGSIEIEIQEEGGGIPEGLEIPGHEILQRVGRGRLGTVYKVRQLSMDRTVAVKVLDEEHSRDEAFVGSFFRQAREAANLGHGNIVRVFDANRAGDVCYFSMEFVDGTTLARILRKEGKIGIDRALDVARQVARGLQHAHSHGVIHEDVKPASIMIARDGEAKLAEVGIAKVFDRLQAGKEAETMGRSGLSKPFLGTPHYMSPEQALRRKVDARTDIYSLGATLYHMLTGTVPFQGDTEAEIARAHSTGSLTAIQEIEPFVPDSVAALVERMMARDPAGRYQSADDLLRELERVIADREVKVEAVDPGVSTIMKAVPAVVMKKRKHVARKQMVRRGAAAIPGIVGVGGIAAMLIVGFVIIRSIARRTGVPSRSRAARTEETPQRVTRTADGRRTTDGVTDAPASGVTPRPGGSFGPAGAGAGAVRGGLAGRDDRASAGDARTGEALSHGALVDDAPAPDRLTAAVARAVDAAERGAPADEQVELFAKAYEAHAGFDDKAYFLMAKAYHEAKRDDVARKFIAQISSLYLRNPEVEALRVGLGVAVAPPRLDPKLLVCTFVGGKGDQYISDVGFSGGGFSGAGAVFGKGAGFTVFYDLRTMKGRVQGDVNTHDESRYGTKPPLPGGRGKAVKDPRNGQTYHVGCRQVHRILQQPFLNSSAGWKLWGWSHADAKAAKLMADSRAYDCWLMPEGKIGVKCWTGGGSSVLTRDPRDLRKPNPIEKLNPYKRDAGGMASMFMLVDPKDGTPLSGTFLRSHVTRQAVDPWGRVYLPKPNDRASNPFGQARDAGGGLFVLEPSLLRLELNVRIGGGGSRGAQEVFGYIALRGNIAVLGGTTGAKQMKSVNPVQDAPGGGQDGLFAVVRLWEKTR